MSNELSALHIISNFLAVLSKLYETKKCRMVMGTTNDPITILIRPSMLIEIENKLYNDAYLGEENGKEREEANRTAGHQQTQDDNI